MNDPNPNTDTPCVPAWLNIKAIGITEDLRREAFRIARAIDEECQTMSRLVERAAVLIAEIEARLAAAGEIGDDVREVFDKATGARFLTDAVFSISQTQALILEPHREKMAELGTWAEYTARVGVDA